MTAITTFLHLVMVRISTSLPSTSVNPYRKSTLVKAMYARGRVHDPGGTPTGSSPGRYFWPGVHVTPAGRDPDAVGSSTC
jgi:hypothetical protein